MSVLSVIVNCNNSSNSQARNAKKTFTENLKKKK